MKLYVILGIALASVAGLYFFITKDQISPTTTTIAQDNTYSEDYTNKKTDDDHSNIATLTEEETKPEAKEEAKPEVKEEAKPEVKEEAKPEEPKPIEVPEVKEEVKPEEPKPIEVPEVKEEAKPEEPKPIEVPEVKEETKPEEPKPIEVPEVKEETKPEVKEEVKPEEPKPIEVPEVKEETKPEEPKPIEVPEVKEETKPEEPKPIEVPEVKEETKPEVKEETKPEVKEETKPEEPKPIEVPEVKEEVKPEEPKPIEVPEVQISIVSNPQANIILLDEKEISNLTTVVAGKHTIQLERKGYKTVQAEIEVPQQDIPFVYQVTLEPLPRKVNLHFKSEFGEPNTEKIAVKWLKQGQEVTELFPGEYIVQVNIDGYEPIEDVVTIAQDQEVVERTIELYPSMRVLEIVMQNANAEILPLDSAKIDNMAYFPNCKIKPGEHAFFWKELGYKEINTTIVVPVGVDAYVYNPVAEFVARHIIIECIDKNSKQPVQATILVNNQPYDTNSAYLPKNYTLQANCEKYKSYTEEIVLPIGEDDWKHTIELEADVKGVLLKLEFVMSFADKYNVSISRILFDNKEIENNSIVPFGKHTVTVMADGFETWEKEIEIAENSTEYVIQEAMQPLPRKLNLIINTDYPAGALLEPDEVLIDHKPYEGKIFPGIHKVEIIKAGYQSIEEEILVKLHEDVEFLRIMEVLPRSIRWNIVDSVQGKRLAPEKIEINKRNVVNDPRLSLTPGMYEISVYLIHYQTYQDMITVEPGNDMQEITIKLIPEGTEVEEVQKEKETTNAPVSVTPGQTRSLVFKGYQADYQVIQPLKIYANGKEVTDEEKYEVGSLVQLKLLFKDFMTVYRDVFIEAGDTPQELPFPLSAPLKSYVFTTTKQNVSLDNIDYEYEFIDEDDKKIEAHLVTIEEQNRQYTITVKVPEYISQLKVRAGYTYAEKLLNKAVQAIGYLQKIDIYALKEHIERIRRSQGAEKALTIFRNLVKSKLSVLKLLHDEEKVYLINYITSWNVEEENLIELRDAVEENLNKLLD